MNFETFKFNYPIFLVDP